MLHYSIVGITVSRCKLLMCVLLVLFVYCYLCMFVLCWFRSVDVNCKGQQMSTKGVNSGFTDYAGFLSLTSGSRVAPEWLPVALPLFANRLVYVYMYRIIACIYIYIYIYRLYILFVIWIAVSNHRVIECCKIWFEICAIFVLPTFCQGRNTAEIIKPPFKNICCPP